MRAAVAVVLTLLLLPANAVAATDLTLVSDRGDPTGEGRTLSFDGSAAGFRASGDRWGVGASVILDAEQDQRVSMFFSPPIGDVIAPGRTFTNAARYGFHSPGPGMSVSMEDGCNEIAGTFTVESVTFHRERMKSVVLHFEQHCEGLTPALRGTLRWHAGEPNAPDPEPATFDELTSGRARNRVGWALGALERTPTRAAVSALATEIGVHIRQMKAVRPAGSAYRSRLREYRRAASAVRSARRVVRNPSALTRAVRRIRAILGPLPSGLDG
jgi:hypothetical protein